MSMSALSHLTSPELRLVTRLLNTLRKDHGVQLGFRDPKLDVKLFSEVDRLNDPVIHAMWNALPQRFCITALVQWEKLEGKPFGKPLNHGQFPEAGSRQKASGGDARLTYRGVRVNQQTSVPEGPLIDEPVQEPTKKQGGKYITYRGTKQWVPD